ncbi:MAG: hypothetical protein OEM63_06395 [Gammaproteobacteria bacterium]|nr:hypothetical protein [Gammaproteobacteria bacterium]
MKYLAALAMPLVVACSPLHAEESVILKVSATIPPRPCEHPERCDSTASRAIPAAVTRVVVSEDKISYVGSTPAVEKKDDLLVVRF